MKKLHAIKMEALTSWCREEKKKVIKESKNDNEMYVENPLKGRKNHVWARMNIPCSVKLCIMYQWRFPLYNGNILTKGKTFSLSYFLTNFQTFSLLFCLYSYPSSPTTCSSYSPRNVDGYKIDVTLWFLHLNPNTAVVLCSGWRWGDEV